jgi:hypothetical protein
MAFAALLTACGGEKKTDDTTSASIEQNDVTAGNDHRVEGSPAMKLVLDGAKTHFEVD